MFYEALVLFRVSLIVRVVRSTEPAWSGQHLSHYRQKNLCLQFGFGHALRPTFRTVWQHLDNRRQELKADLLIRGAMVYDGTASPGVRADVLVHDGVVREIGSSGQEAVRVVDADGLALMPGIVDLHTHFDAQVTWDRTLSPSPALGVTTVVMGNCGFGIAPCPTSQRETMLKNLSVVEGMDLDALMMGVDWQFETFGQYMDQLRRIGPYANVAVFAGHSVIRTAVMGAEASSRVEPDPDQLRQMCELVDDAMRAGAIGFASSFSPNHSGFDGRPMPSTIATEQELLALTDVLGRHGKGVFMMATGSRATPEFMESIVARTGRPAFISTVLAMYNEGTPDLALQYYEKCAAAQSRGHDLHMLTSCQPLSFDFSMQDPYVLISHPSFERVRGKNSEQARQAYADPAFRESFRRDLQNPTAGVLFLGNWRQIEVAQAATEAYKAFEGMSVDAIARQTSADPLEVFFDIVLAEDLQTRFVGKFFNSHDPGVAPLLKHPAGVITLSDAGAHLLYMCDAGFGLHLLQHWVRDLGLFSWEEAIRRLTSHPAEQFRIAGRGYLRPGAPADMLLFDPATVGIGPVKAVTDLPGGGTRRVRDPIGVHGVWVNGVQVHDGQRYVNMPAGPGRVLTEFVR